MTQKQPQALITIDAMLAWNKIERTAIQIYRPSVERETAGKLRCRSGVWNVEIARLWSRDASRVGFDPRGSDNLYRVLSNFPKTACSASRVGSGRVPTNWPVTSSVMKATKPARRTYYVYMEVLRIAWQGVRVNVPVGSIACSIQSELVELSSRA